MAIENRLPKLRSDEEAIKNYIAEMEKYGKEMDTIYDQIKACRQERGNLLKEWREDKEDDESVAKSRANSAREHQLFQELNRIGQLKDKSQSLLYYIQDSRRIAYLRTQDKKKK